MADDEGPARPPDARLATGARVQLPAAARPLISVYVNGTLQAEGVDYVLGNGELRFIRPLRRPAERFWHRAVQTLAGVGIYNQGDAVDLHYVEADGTANVLTQVPLAFPPRG